MPVPPIPLSKPDITQREIDAVIDVLHTDTLSIGPKALEFETLCAKVAERRHAIAVSSGTAGLHCALIAAGVEAGDEVIVTPFSFVASTNPVLYVGAKPVFVDIDPATLNIDLEKVPAAVTPRTRAIIGVEVFGHPGGMPELEQLAQKNELALIEDACDGFGGHAGRRAIGSFGRASVFGFYPNKQVTTGEGGMIVTDDDALAAVCRSLRNQGRDPDNWLSHERLGFNYRMSELNAALGVAQVNRLDEILADRRRVAHLYMDRLMTSRFVTLPTLTADDNMSWVAFVVRLNDLFDPGDRDAVLHMLREEGIGCNSYFPPIHLQPYMARQFGHKPGDFPMCEYVSARTLALPFFTKMTSNQVERVCDVLEKNLEKMLVAHRKRFR